MAEARPIEAAEITWLHGAFRCAMAGDQRDAWGGSSRLHGVRLLDARVTPVDGLDAASAARAIAAAGRDVLALGHVEPLWVQLRDATTWLRVAVQDAVVIGPSIRLARDDGDRSLTIVSGTLVGRLAAPETSFAGVGARAANIGTQVGSVGATEAVIAAHALPVQAGGIAWADAQVGSDAPPGCASIALGAALVPMGCLATPLAVAGFGAALWGALGWGLALAGAGVGLALLLLPLAARRWGLVAAGRGGWALTALAWLLALLAVLPGALAWLRGDCDPSGALTWLALALAVVFGATSAARATRPVLLGLSLLALALHGYAHTGCVDGPMAAAQQWSLDETAHDADAERAAKLQSGGGGRISLDQALAMNWPPTALCGRTVHLSDELLFARNEAQLARGAAPHLRKLAALLRRHPEASLRLLGHADGVGDAAANVALSLRRASAVRAWLIHRGAIAAGRVEAVGIGASQPLVTPRSPDDEDSHRLNRRVEAMLRCGASAAPAPEAATATEAP